MHILIIPSWYPTTPGSFVGSFFREQAIAYKEYYPQDEVGVLYVHSYSIKSIGRKIRYNSVDNGVNTLMRSFIRLPRFRRVFLFFIIFNARSLFKKYVRLYGMPDIIHVQSGWPVGVVAMKIKQKYDIPYLLTEHSSVLASLKPHDFQLKMFGKIFRLAERLIAVSGSYAALLSDKFNLDFSVIPNIANSEFLLTGMQADSTCESFTFVSIGSLAYGKGHDLLLNAFSRLIKKGINVKLIIVGGGSDKEKLQQATKELGINQSVKFVGELLRGEVLELLSTQANAFVLSSRAETFGVVFVEALAIGLPVIGTRCGGPENVINDKVGYLIDNENVDELAEAMLTLYARKQYWYEQRENIKSYCKENFSASVVMQKYHELYSEILYQTK